MMNIHIFTAVKQEAIPFIEYFKLQRSMSSPFEIFQGSHVKVIISGIGKIAMATACGFMLSFIQKPKEELFLNFGVAGHRDLMLGTCIFADKIVDNETKKVFFPSLIFHSPFLTQAICTVSAVETVFPDDCVYDMEASAFFSALSRFALIDLIQCVKVISDNQHTPFSHFQPEMMKQHLPALEEVFVQFQNKSLKKETVDLSAFFARWHFTETLKHQLIKEAERWHVLYPHFPLTTDPYKQINSAKEVIAQIKTHLEKKMHKA
jgi:nucleoside phosphorylase